MTLNFQLVPEEKDADISIQCNIIEYFWTDNDPIDMVGGAGGILYDVVTKSDYARMQAEMTVVDQKNGRELWQERVIATISDDRMPPGKSMSREESVPMINEQLVRIFMRDCFSKNHVRRSTNMM